MTDPNVVIGAGGSAPDDATAGVAAYIEAVASRAPTPGGGSVVGVTAALAAALGSMVCRFTLPAASDQTAADSLAPALAELDRLRSEMLALANADAAAYDAYRAATVLSKATDEERRHRREAMQAALVGATEVPLAVARGSARIRRLLAEVAEAGNPHLRSDAEIGGMLAEAALRGALVNVRGNAALLKDSTIARRYQDEADNLERHLLTDVRAS